MREYTLFKIKPGKRQVWLDWCAELMSSAKEEASITLKEEQLLRELCIVFGEGDESFVVYHHIPEVGKEKLPANLSRELNVKHFQVFDECLIPWKPRVLGYDINAPA